MTNLTTTTTSTATPQTPLTALTALTGELERQLDRLVSLGYARLASLSEAEFRALADPVRRALAIVAPATADPSSSRLGATPSSVPFLLVMARDVVPAEAAMPLTTLDGRSAPGFVDRNHGEGDLATYRPIEQIDGPSTGCYALLDVERGEEFCGVRPADALPVVLGRHRSPLTIEEGVALVTQFPEVLEPNRCFMLSGSRRGDQRVPALWISQRAPKLGWCWDRNPHSWLGTASTGSRVP